MTDLTSGNSFCAYYQAYIVPEHVLYIVAVLKSFDHLAFDRTIDVEKSIFEFFVPQSMEQQFLRVMRSFENDGIVTNLKKLPNRLLDPAQQL